MPERTLATIRGWIDRRRLGHLSRKLAKQHYDQDIIFDSITVSPRQRIGYGSDDADDKTVVAYGAQVVVKYNPLYNNKKALVMNLYPDVDLRFRERREDVIDYSRSNLTAERIRRRFPTQAVLVTE